MLHVGEDLAIDPDGDVDNDGVLDGYERWYFGSTSPGSGDDFDGDGATLLVEYQNGSDPTVPDTDGDGILDGSDSAPQDASQVTDADSDGVINVCDNCPSWPNASQSLPSWAVPPGDVDCDGFPSSVGVTGKGAETDIGTDPNVRCAANNVADNEGLPDAWPYDFNDNQRADLSDVLGYIPVFNSFFPIVPYDARWDLNASGGITLADVLSYIPVFNLTCT